MSARGSPRWWPNRAATGGYRPFAQAALVERLHQPPALFGVERSRWRLADLRATVACVRSYRLSSISALLKRLRVGRHRGRWHIHSPDLAYQQKQAWLGRARTLAQAAPERVRLLYGDEATLYRQPTLGPQYARRGVEPLVNLVPRANTRWRLSAALDSVSGQVVWTARSHMDVPGLCQFLGAIRAAYPDQILLLAWDNWPVHQHPAVLARAAALEIELLWLPTYAPWTNPTEKLWRWLRQDLVHAHRLAHAWPSLKDRAHAFLDQFRAPSPALLRYVGLST